MWYRSKTERVSWPVMVTATPLGSVGIPEPSWRPDDLLPKAPCRGTTIAPRGGRGQAPGPGRDRPRGPSGREQPPPMALGQKEPGPAGAGTKGVGTPQDRVDLGDHERPRAGGEPGSCGMNAAPAVSTPKRTTTRSFERTGRRAVSCSIRLAAAAASATGPPMASRGRARAVRATPPRLSPQAWTAPDPPAPAAARALEHVQGEQHPTQRVSPARSLSGPPGSEA
jgi:hypothetical protein